LLTYHLRVSNETALQNKGRLRSEPRGIPDDEIGQLVHLDAAYEMTETLGNGRVDGVFAYIPLHSEVVTTTLAAGCSIFRQCAPLQLILVRRIPCAQNDLATAAHGLRVGAHHADGAEVVQDILGGNGLCADAALGKGYVLGDILGQVVAHHEHVEVLVEGIARIRPRRVRGRREYIGVLDDGDDVWGVAATSALGVVGVYSAILERVDGGLDEAGLVERVCMDEALDVKLVTDTQTSVNGCRRSAPVLVNLETTCAGGDLLSQSIWHTVVALGCDADVEREGVACLEHLPHVVLSWRTGCGACSSTMITS
jgi:hypothetical protein